MKTRIASTSTEYVRVAVRATEDGAAVDPTTDVVQLAFLQHDEKPDPPDFVAAEWETEGTRHLARCLVGPAGGAVTLVRGSYRVWVRIVDNPEVPIIYSGVLVVT